MTCGPSQVGRASRGSEKLLREERYTGAILCLDFSAESAALIPKDSLWLQGRRQKGSMRVTVSPWMEPPARTGLFSHPHCPSSPQPLTLPTEKCLLAQGLMQGKHRVNGPPCFNPSPHLSCFFLSRDVVGPECPECPQEPGRGSPGQREGQSGGNTLCSRERSQSCPGKWSELVWAAQGPGAQQEGSTCCHHQL